MKRLILFLTIASITIPWHSAQALPPCSTFVDDPLAGTVNTVQSICHNAALYQSGGSNYCPNVHGNFYVTVPLCALNTDRTLCVARPPSEIQADLCPEARQIGRCEGACPQVARSATIEQEVIKLNAPRLQIPLITLQPFTGSIRDFKLAHQVKEGDKTFLIIDYLANYLAAVYTFLISIAGIVAGIMIIWAGVKWLTSAGYPDRIADAKKKVADALLGLILVLCSYVILQLVNPDLVFFKPLRVQTIERIELTAVEQEEEGITQGGQPVITGTACNTLDTCRQLCNQPHSSWPNATTTTPAPEQLQIIKAMPGLDVSACPDDCKSTAAFVSAITRAAGTAQAAPGGPYTLKITSAFRPVKKQIKLLCDTIPLIDEGKYDPRKLGVAIAWPGASNHGKGIATDIALLKNNQVVSCAGCYNSQTQGAWRVGAETLANIMFQNGFVRYCREIWHFELPSGLDCRSNTCRTNTTTCP